MKLTLAFVSCLALCAVAIAQTPPGPPPAFIPAPPPGGLNQVPANPGVIDPSIAPPNLPVALLPSGAPFNYEQVNIGGLLTTIPSLSTALASWVQIVESESVLSLFNEGMNGAAGVQAQLRGTADVICAEASGTLSECPNEAAAEAPFLAQLAADFARVPASQWNPATFSANLGVSAAQFKPAPPSPLVPSRSGSNMVNVATCVVPSGSAITMCLGGPGSNAAQASNGALFGEGGVAYVTHVSNGLFGRTVWYEPVNVSAK